MAAVRTAACLVVLALAAAGCATPYLIHLTSGEVMEASDEPEFDKTTGFYQFEDTSGRRVRLNKDQIVSMEEAPH